MKTQMMTSTQIKKKRKRKGLDLEAPEVVLKFFGRQISCCKGRHVRLAGQGAGEDPTGEEPAREGEVQVCREGGQVNLVAS